MRHLIHVSLLLGLLSAAACAGTQTREAFTLRSPAPGSDPRSLVPNHAAEHEASLRRALDNATTEQEAADRLPRINGTVTVSIGSKCRVERYGKDLDIVVCE